jgi:hypothetical protein
MDYVAFSSLLLFVCLFVCLFVVVVVVVVASACYLLTDQALGDLSGPLIKEILEAFRQSKAERLRLLGDTLIDLIGDIDRILSTMPSYSIKELIRSVHIWTGALFCRRRRRRCCCLFICLLACLLELLLLFFLLDDLVDDDMERDRLLRNFLRQITLWGDATPNNYLNEYAYKLWGGFVARFYGGRWKLFLATLEANVRTAKFEEKEWNERLLRFESDFSQAAGNVTAQFFTSDAEIFAKLDPVLLSQSLEKKWSRVVEDLALIEY